MKIVVLNGSPKGEISVTVQYVRYIQKHFPQHEFRILSVGHEVVGLDHNQARWREVMDEVACSQVVLWATPVYFFLVPSQLKRFIELIAERQAEGVFGDKYCAALVTSVHCMDHTAMNYLTGISEDLSMRFVGCFSAEMDDLEIPEERTNLLNFASLLFHAAETGMPSLRNCAPIVHEPKEYRPAALAAAPKTGKGRVVVMTDGNDPASNLGRMIETLQQSSRHEVEVIDLQSLHVKGGCLGCIQCAYDNTCAYKDGLKQFIEEKLLPAEAILFAGAIHDRYLSWRWKQFFDRSFVFGHTPALTNKQMGFIISGPLRQMPNLRQLFEVYVEEQRCNLVGFATDEDTNPQRVTEGLQGLAAKLDWALAHDQKTPHTCISVGLRLLFKDFVKTNSGLFRADHIYYKKHGLYRGHRNRFKRWLQNLLFTFMCSVPFLRRQFQKQMKVGMIADLKKIVDKAGS